VKIPNHTREARGGLKLNPTLEFRPATASRTRRTPKKNAPCISDLRAGEFFLKKERVFFFRGFDRKDIQTVWRGFKKELKTDKMT